MPEEKKPWEQDLVTEEKSSAKKPWEQEFEASEAEKKKLETIPSPSASPLLNTESLSTGGESASSGKYNFVTGENQLPPFSEKPPLQTPVNEADLLRAAPSTGETTPKDINQFSPDIQKNGLQLGDKTESFIRGVSRLGSSILKTPAFAYDIASAVTNKVINEPFGIPNAPSSEQISKDLGIENTPAGELDKAITNSQKRYEEKYDKGVTDYFKAGDYEKGFDVLANAVVESAPTTIALMFGNAAGLSTAGSVGAGGLVFGADKMSQLEKENPDMTHEQKTAVALSSGLMEGAFEQFGLTKLGAVTKAVLKKSGEEAAKEVAKEGFKKTYGKILTRYLGTSAEEALSEAATQFSQNAIDKYSGVNPDLDLKTGLSDAAIIGLGAGTTIGAPTSALGVARTREAVKRASEIEKHKSILEDQLQNPDVSESVKPAIANRIKDLNAEDAKIAAEEKKKFDQLPEDKKTEVDNLLKKSHDIATSAVDETISADTKEIFKRDIDNIDEKIDSIYEEAEKEREQAATEKGLVKGEKKSEPIDLSIDIEELPMTADKENEDRMKSFEESIEPQETPMETITPKTENNATKKGIITESDQQQHPQGSTSGKTEPSGNSNQPEQSGEKQQEKVKEKPVQELIDEQEQIEAKKEDDEASVKKLNDDIEILKKFDKPDIASKKFSAEAETKTEQTPKEDEVKFKIKNSIFNVNLKNITIEDDRPDINGNVRSFTVKSNGKELMDLSVVINNNGTATVMRSYIKGDEEFNSKKGIGTIAHKKLAEYIKKTYNADLISSFNLSDSAKALWEKLVKTGDAEKIATSKEDLDNKKTDVKHYYKFIVKPESEVETPAKEPSKKEEVKPESEERNLSGIKKALLSDEVINSVEVHEEDMKNMSRKEMHILAKKLIDSGEVNPEEIVNEVLIKHRALQPKEVIGLIYYKTELDNKQYNLSKERTKLIKEGESTGSVDAKLVDINQKIQNYNLQSAITARQNSLAFSLRQALRDSEFNLVTEIERYKATNNGVIPADVEARMKELDKECREMSQKIKELEQEKEEREIEDAHRDIIEDIERAKSSEKKKNYTQKSKELADKVRKLKGKPLTFTTKDGKEVPIKKQGLGTDAILEIAARTIETTGKVIDGVNAVIKQVKDQDWYKALTKEDKEGFAKQLHERFGEDEKPIAKAYVDDEGKLVIPHSLIRSIYESGITDINKIVEAVQKELDMPEVTDRQIRDAITRYGKTVNLNKDEIEAGIRQAKRIGKLISQLEDIQKKERPKRSGLQRDKPSDEERRLMKEVKREMKSLPEDPEEDASNLKSALEATKTRLKNRIKDLENQLATGEKTPKSKGVELDAEAKELKEKVEKLRAELESVEGKPKISDEQRLARMKTYTQNRIKDLEAKIKKQDFSKPEKRKPISDNELTKARGELADKRDEWEKLQYENELKNRTKWQKAGHLMMGALNIPRAFKLSLDLSAVGVQGGSRLVTSPIQSSKAFWSMLKDVYNEKNQKEWMKTLKGQDYYHVLKAAGAAFTELNGKISVREENFSNDLVKLMFEGVFNEKLIVGEVSADRFNPYNASNRAFSGYLNSIRLQGYIEGFRRLERKGMTFESHPQDYKSWVKYINLITGRGSLGKRGNSSQLAQFVFTAPRKIISELNLINPHLWGNVIMKDTGKDYDYMLTPTVARMAVGDFVLGRSLLYIAAALGRAAFSDDDDKHDKDFYDPRSSNFGSIKIRDTHGGFTVINPQGSLKTEEVLFARLLTNSMANSRTGKVKPLGKGGNPKGMELISNFLQNKLSPTIQAAIVQPLKQGEKYDFKKEALRTIEPATLEGFLQTYKDYPTETEAALTALAFFGVAETHIEKKKR